MLPQKKKDEFEGYSNEKSEEIDFLAILVNGMQMGLTKTEVEQLRIGQYLEMFNRYKAIFNMRADGMKYKFPEKRTSMLDL